MNLCGRTDMLNGFILIMVFNYVEMLNRVYLMNNFNILRSKIKYKLIKNTVLFKSEYTVFFSTQFKNNMRERNKEMDKN